MEIARFRRHIEAALLPGLRLESRSPHDPVVPVQVPPPWEVLGTGNYAAVLAHPDWPLWAVKVYAPGRPGLTEEAEVYRRLGTHPAFSQCLHAGDTFLVLRRLRGLTLYECLRRGCRIPPRLIEEVDEALAYARRQGLHPHDVHAKNVMMLDGHGLVADVSDFLEEERCTKWEDFKRAYYRFYLPLFSRRALPIPLFLLEAIRRGYRLVRQGLGSSAGS